MPFWLKESKISYKIRAISTHQRFIISVCLIAIIIFYINIYHIIPLLYYQLDCTKELNNISYCQRYYNNTVLFTSTEKIFSLQNFIDHIHKLCKDHNVHLIKMTTNNYKKNNINRYSITIEATGTYYNLYLLLQAIQNYEELMQYKKMQLKKEKNCIKLSTTLCCYEVTSTTHLPASLSSN